jgi:site-specific DNA-methyltransferase (adenine-specific)
MRNSISTVINIDCKQYMKSIPDNFFDLAITDPPYGINAEQGTNRASRKQFKEKKYGWDSKIPDEEYFNELFRVSKHQIIWGGNYFLELIGNCRCFIIWDKLNPDRCFADCEFAWTSFDEVARIFKPKRVQELNEVDGGKIHPTQKPIALYRWCLENYAKEGFKIFDSHLGSGSHRIAAKMLGFDFFACELDKDYFDAQDLRYNNFIKKASLFLPAQEDKKILNGKGFKF